MQFQILFFSKCTFFVNAAGDKLSFYKELFIARKKKSKVKNVWKDFIVTPGMPKSWDWVLIDKWGERGPLQECNSIKSRGSGKCVTVSPESENLPVYPFPVSQVVFRSGGLSGKLSFFVPPKSVVRREHFPHNSADFCSLAPRFPLRKVVTNWIKWSSSIYRVQKPKILSLCLRSWPISGQFPSIKPHEK